MRIFGTLLRAFRLSRLVSCSSTTQSRYSSLICSSFPRSPSLVQTQLLPVCIASRSFGSKSGNSKFINRKFGRSSRRHYDKSKSGESPARVSRLPARPSADILPVALINNTGHNASSMKILLIPINLFEGGDEAVEKTLAMLSIIRDNARQIEAFTDNLPNSMYPKTVPETTTNSNESIVSDDFNSGSIGTGGPRSPTLNTPLLDELDGAEELVLWPTAEAINEQRNDEPTTIYDGLDSGLAEHEIKRIQTYDAFDADYWSRSKKNLFSPTIKTRQERFLHLPVSSMHLAFEMDMKNVKDSVSIPPGKNIGGSLLTQEVMPLEDSTPSLTTYLEMLPVTQENKVPLNFNALIQGTVEIDASRISPDQLRQMRAPEFSDYVTSLAANICSTALQRGFPTDINRMSYSTKTSQMMADSKKRNPHIVCVRDGEKGCISPGLADNPKYVPSGAGSTGGLLNPKQLKSKQTSCADEAKPLSSSAIIGDCGVRGLMSCKAYARALQEAEKMRAAVKSSRKRKEDACTPCTQDEKPTKSSEKKCDKKSADKAKDSCSTTVRTDSRKGTCTQEKKADKSKEPCKADKKEDPCKTEKKADKPKIGCVKVQNITKADKAKSGDPCKPEKKADKGKGADPCKSEGKEKKKTDTCKSDKSVKKQNWPDECNVKEDTFTCRKPKPAGEAKNPCTSGKKDAKDSCKSEKKAPCKADQKKEAEKKSCKPLAPEKKTSCSGKGSAQKKDSSNDRCKAAKEKCSEIEGKATKKTEKSKECKSGPSKKESKDSFKAEQKKNPCETQSKADKSKNPCQSTQSKSASKDPCKADKPKDPCKPAQSKAGGKDSCKTDQKKGPCKSEQKKSCASEKKADKPKDSCKSEKKDPGKAEKKVVGCPPSPISETCKSAQEKPSQGKCSSAKKKPKTALRTKSVPKSGSISPAKSCGASKKDSQGSSCQSSEKKDPCGTAKAPEISKCKPGAESKPKSSCSGSKPKSSESKPKSSCTESKPKSSGAESKPKSSCGGSKPKTSESKPKISCGGSKPKSSSAESKPKSPCGESKPKSSESKAKSYSAETKPKEKTKSSDKSKKSAKCPSSTSVTRSTKPNCPKGKGGSKSSSERKCFSTTSLVPIHNSINKRRLSTGTFVILRNCFSSMAAGPKRFFASKKDDKDGKKSSIQCNTSNMKIPKKRFTIKREAQNCFTDGGGSECAPPNLCDPKKALVKDKRCPKVKTCIVEQKKEPSSTDACKNWKENKDFLRRKFSTCAPTPASTTYSNPPKRNFCTSAKKTPPEDLRNQECDQDESGKKEEEPTNEVIKVVDACQVEAFSDCVPFFSDYDVIIRTDSVAISGSDLHVYETGGKSSPGITLGHDASGIIEKTGKCVQHLRPGDRVAIESGLSCGICEFCKRGTYNICSQLIHNGFFAKLQVHPADLCHKLPDSVSLENGCFAQILATGCQACWKAGIKPTSNVLIMGSSPTAIAAGLCVRTIGANRICFVCSHEVNLEVVRTEFNFDYVIYDCDMEIKDMVQSIYCFLREWPDVVINCAVSEITLNLAVMTLAPNGVCVLAECESECASFNAMEVIMKNLKLIPSFRSTNMFSTALLLMESGQAPMHHLVAKTFRWNQVHSAFVSALHHSNISNKKVIVRCRDAKTTYDDEA